MFYRNCIVLTFVVVFCPSSVYTGIFPFIYPRIKLDAKWTNDTGSPLLLTPYVQKGQIELAQNLSRVSITEKLGFISYAGFFTVDPKYNSNLYFWYFPPFSKTEAAPVILWLQGGPGASSLFGLFTENGPLYVKKNKKFSVRKYHWALHSHLIFIDSPVGTGFSFTDHDSGYCSDQQCVAKGLYSCLQQFFMLFPKLSKNKFYITGESYAGKYIPSLAMEIHEQNVNQQKINLKGLALGNAYCDPVNQIDYGNYLYQHGLIDDIQKDLFFKYQTKIVEEISKENWIIADVLMDELMDGDLTNFSYFKTYTGFDTYYNFLEAKATTNLSVFLDILHDDRIRSSIHVGGLPFHSGQEVQLHLASDILKSVAPVISKLLSHYRLMFYSGQLDIIVAYPLTENFLRKLNFTSSDEYRKSQRHIWRVGSDIAGYSKKAGNISDVIVRNAGHMVPHDQPKWAYYLIIDFINNKI